MSNDRTSWTVRVNGNGHPFWLVLGQSVSAGWSASVAGGHRLGAPQLVDGYANGWYVPAGLIKGPTTVTINWRPQEVVWAAIGVSAVALAASVGLVLWPGAGAAIGGGSAPAAGGTVSGAGTATPGKARRRRRSRWLALRRRDSVAGSGPEPGSTSLGRGDDDRNHSSPDDRRDRPSAVSWASVCGLGGRRPQPMRIVVAALSWGLVASAVSRPAIGALCAVAVAAGCWWTARPPGGARRRHRLARRARRVRDRPAVAVSVPPDHRVALGSQFGQRHRLDGHPAPWLGRGGGPAEGSLGGRGTLGRPAGHGEG